jgi:hypothetical protein
MRAFENSFIHFQNQLLIMPSFDTTVTEIRDNPSGGCTVIIRPHELETTTDLSSVLIEPKFATNGGTIHSDHIELYCAERPPVHEGQSLMIRSLDPHGE